jgi:hypothetical protein
MEISLGIFLYYPVQEQRPTVWFSGAVMTREASVFGAISESLT